MKNKVYGSRIKVEKILEKINPLEPPQYNNKVKIISLGIDLKAEHLEVGQELLIMSEAGYEIDNRMYITENHIIEIIYPNN